MAAACIMHAVKCGLHLFCCQLGKRVCIFSRKMLRCTCCLQMKRHFISKQAYAYVMIILHYTYGAQSLPNHMKKQNAAAFADLYISTKTAAVMHNQQACCLSRQVLLKPIGKTGRYTAEGGKADSVSPQRDSELLVYRAMEVRCKQQSPL